MIVSDLHVLYLLRGVGQCTDSSCCEEFSSCEDHCEEDPDTGPPCSFHGSCELNGMCCPIGILQQLSTRPSTNTGPMLVTCWLPVVMAEVRRI
jgi:hypothetical protein